MNSYSLQNVNILLFLFFRLIHQPNVPQVKQTLGLFYTTVARVRYGNIEKSWTCLVPNIERKRNYRPPTNPKSSNDETEL